MYFTLIICMPNDYSNREIETMFQDIKDTLVRIENQVIKTNGRVTTLELWKEGLMAKLSGVIASITILWVAVKEFILK